MEEQCSKLVAEAILEDKRVNTRPEYPCIYNVRSRDLNNRYLRQKAFQEIAEKLSQPGKSLLWQRIHKMKKKIYSFSDK